MNYKKISVSIWHIFKQMKKKIIFGFIHIYIHTYIHTYIFLKPIILTQELQKHRNSSKSLIRKFSPLQSFLFEKAKLFLLKKKFAKLLFF